MPQGEEPAGASDGKSSSLYVAAPPAPWNTPLVPMKPIPFHVDGPPPLRPPFGAEGGATRTVLPISARAGGRRADSSTWLGGTDIEVGALSAAASKQTAWLLGDAKQEPLHIRCLPTLDWEDRVMGFLGCYAIGFALSVTSIWSFPQLLAGHPGPFAWKYALGGLLGIASTTFLVGPRAQMRSMAAPVRAGATAVYLGSIAATLFSAAVLRVAPVTLAAMVLQFVALAYYSASYIPFGRHLLTKCLGKLLRFG